MTDYKTLYQNQLKENKKLKKTNRMLSASIKRTMEADWKNKFYALEEESLKEIADLKQKIKGMKPASTKTNKEWETVFEATSKEIADLKEENDNWEADDANLTKIICMINALDEDFSVGGVDDIYECVKELKKEIAELQEQNEYHERECDRLSELECIAWIDFYGEETVEDDIKAYIFRRDIVHMKEENEELKKKLQKYQKK